MTERAAPEVARSEVVGTIRVSKGPAMLAVTSEGGETCRLIAFRPDFLIFKGTANPSTRVTRRRHMCQFVRQVIKGVAGEIGRKRRLSGSGCAWEQKAPPAPPDGRRMQQQATRPARGQLAAGHMQQPARNGSGRSVHAADDSPPRQRQHAAGRILRQGQSGLVRGRGWPRRNTFEQELDDLFRTTGGVRKLNRGAAERQGSRGQT